MPHNKYTKELEEARAGARSAYWASYSASASREELEFQIEKALEELE